ncbi:HPF/RaiA family ribosome-associated protein [Antarcticimicrobium luteum]|nr:HPF/RaiA family ribosome-associated protein [Antarcticimicrobium luteum]
METTPQITFRGLEARPEITEMIEEKIAKLEEVSNRITSARVTVELRSGKGHKGHLYQVAVELEVPAGTVIVNHKPGDLGAHEDLRVAVRDSFNAARRQLREHMARLDEQQVRSYPERRHGTVVRLFPDEGYGFIENAERDEVFFDRDSVNNNGWTALDIYSEVAFTQQDGDKGLFAANVTLVSRPGG